jgi:hypothetical protein
MIIGSTSITPSLAHPPAALAPMIPTRRDFDIVQIPLALAS